TEIKLDSAAVKSASNKIEEIRKNSLAKIERMEITAGSASIARRQEYIQKLNRIMEGANSKNIGSIRRMVREAEAEYAKWNRMAIKQINDEAKAREKAAREVAGPTVDPEIEKRRNTAEKARE